MEQNLFYSVIIPHHNIPNLLKRCLDSIPKRSDLQIIVVDDGSDKKGLSKLKILQNIYQHVEFYYSTPAHGGGFARNMGLSKARGRYVLFADADDYFNPCLNEILDEYKYYEKDIVFFNANSLDTDYYTFCHRCWQVNYFIELSAKDKDKALFGLRYRFGEPWCKLIRRDIITANNIKFDETIIHNDTTFSYLVGFYSKTFVIDKRALYCVTQRTGSVSKQVSVERWLVRTEVFAKANSFFRNHEIKINDERAYRGVFYFMLKHDMPNIKACMNMLLSSGVSRQKLIISLLFFPCKIMYKLFNERHLKAKLKNKIK